MPRTSSELDNIILRAGAGAGKTTTLTHLFLDYATSFKEKHDRFPHVVVTTFTRKATQELKERLLKLALERERMDLFQYVTNKSHVQISTIHGVLSLFLGRYGGKIGLSSDFKLLTSSQERNLRRKALRRLIFSSPEYEALLESYSFLQLESVLQRYFENSFLYDKFHYITIDDFASVLSAKLEGLEKKRKEIYTSILGETEQASWAAYASGLQKLSLQSSIEDIESTLAGIRDFFADNPRRPAFSTKKPAVSSETNEELISLIEDLKELLDSPEWTPSYWKRHETSNQLFEKLAQEYCSQIFETKVQSGVIAMSDLEIFSLKLIRDSPEVCSSFANEWDYWMIDEYQDTSPLQVSLLKSLVGERKSFVVGDPQQSIYLFRGARSEVFQEKIEELRQTGGDLQEKLVNYRSTPRLLYFINNYFSRSSSQFSPMAASPDREEGPLDHPVVHVRIVQDQEALSGPGEETLAGLHRIQELLAAGVSAEKICVLSRTRVALEKLAKVAEAYGISVQIHVAGGYYSRPEVRDSLALLKFLINPHDNLNFLSCLRSPWMNVSDQEILSYCHSGNHSFWSQAVRLMPVDNVRHPVVLLKKYLRLCQDAGYGLVLRRMLVDLGVFDFAEKLDPTGRREANIWKLISTLFEYERTSGQNLLDFITEGFSATSETEGGNEESDATPVISPRRVNLMTVHASKGLQFDHILLLGMTKKPRLSSANLFSVDEETGQWSLSLMNEEENKQQSSILANLVKSKFNQRELQEHLRVLYVALTRAKEGVTLIFDGKPEKNSWAESCPLDLSIGVHLQENFAYEVLEGSFEPQVFRTEAPLQTNDPGPWEQKEKRETHQTIAVTTLIARENENSASSRPMPAANLQKALAKAYRGVEAHRIFESLKYASLDTVLSTLESDELKSAVSYVAETKEIPLLQIIKNGHAEWGFSFNENQLWIQGQIDLWGEVDGQVWLVDYKTGSSVFANSAFEQLKAYAWALFRMKFITQNQTIHLAVVYPFESKVKVERSYSIPL